jgi:ABC-type transport system involved in cytochrome c biogenesis permease subunit
MQTMEVGHVPVAGATSAISTFVWLLALSYLYIEMTTDERAMGVFILPLLVAFQTIPALHPTPEDRAAVLQGPLFGVHVSSLLFAYASFALACVIGITYVLLFKEIKAKHLGFFYARLPSLQVLDRMNQRAIVIGWIFLTVGIAVGAVWAAQAQGGYGAADPRVQAMHVQDPKIFVALVCWMVYSFELFAARRIGWGGRRAAYLSALGFAIVLLNFVPVSYFFTSSHNF